MRPITKNQLEAVAAVAGITLFITAIFTLVYLITAAVFAHMEQSPSGVVVQALNTLLSLFSLTVILIVVSQFGGASKRSLEAGVFGPIFEAMGKIAKGDFSVKIASDNLQESGIIGELAKSVNTMALELNEMERMRQAFISDVSHEIQSPLTSIRGFAQALQSDSLTVEERHHYLNIIETESMRLSKLTENLLRLASLESEQVKFEPKHYRLDKQIKDLILLCEPQWAGKNIDLEVSLDELVISADEDLLSQVWLNLVANSIKFTPEQGKICVTLHRNANGIEFKITDTGIGISAADQARIFERFYKADKSRTHSTNGGSGLGLSIAQKIVVMHKGTIAVESQLGTGTTFTVSLPN